MSVTGHTGDVGVAVDLVVFTVGPADKGKVRDELRVALIRMKRAPFSGKWALPGGRIERSETVESAAARELRDKTGLANVHLEQLYTFSRLDRDPESRCVSVAHMALIPADSDLRTNDKYDGIGWFSAVRPPTMAFDHKEILGYAVKRLRAKLGYTNVAYSLLPASFSLGELQRLYEAIVDEQLDTRNFQRRVLQLGMVEETGYMQDGTRHRPARLYRFHARKSHELPVLP